MLCTRSAVILQETNEKLRWYRNSLWTLHHTDDYNIPYINVSEDIRAYPITSRPRHHQQ